MASVLAKKKLLDIAQGSGIQQSNRENVLNQLKNSKLEKLAGASVNAGARTAVAQTKAAESAYEHDANTVRNIENRIAAAQGSYDEYLKNAYANKPRGTEKTGTEKTYESAIQKMQDELNAMPEYERVNAYKNGGLNAYLKTRTSQRDALYKLLESANRTVVNPWQDPSPMKGEVEVLRNTAASYEPGSWQADRQGTLATQLADELDYRIGVIEDPAKALEETNAEIAQLEDVKQKASGGAYMGYSLKDIETALENAYKKRTLLEGKTFIDEGAAHQRKMLEIANNETARTDEDFLSGLDDNAMHALKQYGIPEGTTYADYEADDWMDTIHMGSAEAVHDYYALKRTNPELAKRMLEVMQPTINENRARKQVENTAELTERMPFTANVLATGANLLQPVGSLYTIAQQVTGKDVDPNSKWFGASRFAGTVRGTTENMIEEAAKKPAWEKVLKTTYKVGTSIADNAARMLLYRGLGIGGNAGTAAMAFGTYGDNVSQAIESGATQGEAALVGAIQAGLEYATEVMPTNTYMRLLDSKDAKGMRAIMHDVAEAVLGDGFGEAANSAIGTAAENWIIENGGSIDEAADLYMFRGEAKDYEEAVRMAWKDAMGAALYEGMMGALSAGLLSGGIDAVQSGSAQVQKWLDNRKATKQAAQEAQQTEQTAQEAEAPAQEAPAEEMGKVTLESMAQEMAAQSAPKPAAKVTVQTPQEYAAAQDLKEKAQKAKETKPVLPKGGAVVTMADNGYTVEKDGQNVNLEDLDAQSAEARMLNAAQDMTQDAANDMLSRYDEQGDADAQDYAKGYKAVYDAALQGKTLEDAQGLYADELTDAQRRSAYQMGVQARTVENTRIEHLTRQIASRNGLRARASGDGVSLENVTSNLSAEEVNTFKLLDAFGKRFGLSIQIYDTLAGGRANASYQEGTNVVKIARDAEGGAIVRAASHEVYHYLESFSKEDAQKIRAFVLDKLQNNEEFDLDGLRGEYAARYANVQGADVDAEIVADSLLDVIGTEENIKAMAKDNPSLLSRIVDVIQKIREFLRGQLERLAGNSELVDAILQDEEMLSQIQNMAQQGLENARANRDAGSRVTEMAMQDADVQEYMADLGNAENDAERANMLESLAQKKYAATQASVYMETGDYEGGYEAWRQALKDFADQKGALNALLKDAGLATTQSQQENAVLALIGRELKRVDEANATETYSNKQINNEAVTEEEERVKSKKGEKYSIKNPDVENTELFDAAKKTFGTTYNWNETGYVLPDGTRLDMSGKRYGSRGGSRTEDHRDIVEIYENYGDYDGNKAMIDFMGRGAIRISPEGGGINLQKMPTKAQLMALDGFISKFRGEVYVDLDDENGNTIASKEYDRGTFSRKVIADLPMLFEKKKNSGSLVAQFHEQYSLKAEPEELRAARAELAELEKETQELLQKQNEYKATEEYKRMFAAHKAREEGATKAYIEYLKRSGLGKVNSRMNELRNEIYAADKKVRDLEEKQKVKAPESGVTRLLKARAELAGMEMRLDEVQREMDELQKADEFQRIIDAYGADEEGAEKKYNEYLDRTGLRKLAAEQKELREKIADAKRAQEQLRELGNELNEKTNTDAFRKWFGKSKVQTDDGKPMMVYHGSGSEFEEFDYKYLGRHGSAEGQGFYFTDNPSMAAGYAGGNAGKLYAGWLKIENPLSNDKKTMPYAKLKRLISMIDPDGDGVISGYARNTSDYGKPSFYARELEYTARQVYEGNDNDADMIAELANTNGGMDTIAPALRNLGYDGYIVEGKYPGATVYVAFESNQFKSVENVGTFSEETGNMYRSQKQHASNNWFMQNTYDQNVREAGELIEDLYRAREAIGRYEGDKVSNRTWDGVARNVAERLKLDTGSDIDQKRLQSRIKKMYEALDKHGTNIYEAMDYAGSIAEELAQKVDMEEDEQYREIRDRFKEHRYYLSPEMASEIRATYGNVQTFMRKHFGKAKFTTSDSKATGLENIWGELSDEMPHIFKEDAKPSEMVMIVDAFLEDANTRRKEQYYSATINQLRADVAMELFWNYYNTPGVLPTAKSVEELKMQMLKTTSFKDMHFQRYLDAESLRNRLQEQLKEAREGYKLKYMEKVKAFDARENKKEQVKTLTRTSTFIKNRLVHPTREKHIPDGLQQVTAVLADIIDNAGGENGRKYAELKALLLELEKKDADVMMNINGGIYAEGGALDVLMKKAGSNSLMRMSNEELAVLRDVAKNIRHACVVADQLRMEGKTGSVSQIATEMHKEFAQREDRKPTGELKKTLKNLNYHLMDAPRYFRELARFAGKGARDMWTIVRGAEDQKVRNLEEAANLFEEKIGKYDYEKWTGDKAAKHTVQVEGEKIELSTGQLMSLYALNQREAAQSHIYGVQDPATKALEGGGIVASRVKTKDGFVEGVKPRRVTHAHTAEMFKLLTQEQKECANALMEIMSTWCSDKANEVSVAQYGIQLYNEKNYIPINVWQGKKDVHGEEHNMGTMFRLMNKSWTNQLVEKSAEPIVISDIFDVTMKHVNEVCMYNAWTGAVTDMIRLMNYKAKPLATWDDKANKVVQWINKDFGDGSIREDIVRTMGDEAYRWMEQLIKDVNGTVVNRPESDIAKIANKGIRNYKTSKVLNNLGTAVKQPTSIVRAMDVIPAKYFVGKVDLSKEKLELMRKYAPVARWKDWGFFTMDTGRSTESVLLPKKRKAIEKLSDGGMFLAGMGDTVTWMNIWAAAERQVKAANKELDVGSEDFYQKVAKVFSDCIDRTQTVDSLLHRSELMRQNTFGVKMITTFMGEPLKQYNELMDAYLEYKHGNSVSAKRALAKGAWQFTRAAIVAAAVDSLVAALRNLNDDDPFWKQWLARFAGNYEEDMTAAEMAGEFIFSSVGSQLNILNYVPIARDWVEQAQGYDVTRADMGTMDAFMDAAKGIFNEKKPIASRISTLIGALGDIAGLGTTNVIKEAKRIWNFINVTGEKIGMDTVPMQYALLRWEKKLGVTDNSSAYADLILKAEEQGRMDMADVIRKDMLEAGLEEEYIDSKMYKLQVEDLTGIKNASYEKTYAALGAAMKAGDKNLQAALTKELKRAGRTDEQIESGLVNWLKEDPRVISAAQKAVNGNTNEKAQLVKTLRAEGFSDAVAKKAINQLQNKLVSDAKKANTKEEEKPKEPEYEALYTNYDLQTAIENGSDVDDIMEDLRKQGKSDTSIKSSLTSAIKPVYIALMNGTASDKAQAKKIKERLLQLDLKVKYDGKTIDGWLKVDTKK